MGFDLGFSNMSRQAMEMEMWELYNTYRHQIWLACPLIPIVMLFVLPGVLLAMIYISSLFLQIYRRYYIEECQKEPKYWNKARYMLSLLWDAYGWIYYGYEIEGLENIPDKGPAVIIFYHGALPMDWYFMICRCLLIKKRMMVSVADRILFKVPGWGLLLETSRVIPGTSEDCVNVLKNGDLLCLSPGGLREAQFGSENYKLMWGNRCGFARVALEAKVPVIPVFTRNIRETFSTLKILKKWQRRVYEESRYPTAPLYGGFPVKLKTYIGQPIPYDPSISAEELTIKAKESMERMILTHQRLPGSIFHALLERIKDFAKYKYI
ncbi:transmembrane protein 68-like [Centruroides sculpturatus]|uniref:transmembrane protein 68-like n=1 Tax=Centruroides sculpturatus TaxID=218467 RepID=UPI000C6D3C5B|nr:transmembrane protein 68-like [Centruroides sculpturatus]